VPGGASCVKFAVHFLTAHLQCAVPVILSARMPASGPVDLGYDWHGG